MLDSASLGIDSDFISEEEEDLILSDFNETLLDEVEKLSAAYGDPLLSSLAQDQSENEVDSLFDDLERILSPEGDNLVSEVGIYFCYIFVYSSLIITFTIIFMINNNNNITTTIHENH